MPRLNRNGRRALSKAIRCIKAITKVPAGVRDKIAAFDPKLLERIAAKAGRPDLIAALREMLTGVERVRLERPDAAAPAPPRRLTAASAKAEQVATLRKKDAVLGAAIDALDLELLE